MILHESARKTGVFLFFALALCAVSFAEQQAPAPPSIQPQPMNSPGGNIKIFDDKVFDLNGGTTNTDTRSGADGKGRYLDKSKELNYNTEQYERWKASCDSLKEKDMKAYRACVESKKKKELGSRSNFGTSDFGTREPRSGGQGLNVPRPGNSAAPAGINGIRPTPVESSGPSGEGESEGSSSASEEDSE